MADKVLTINGKVLKINSSVLTAPTPAPTEPDYLCFTAEEANSSVELCKVGSPSIANTAYSTNGITWTTFTPSTTAGTNKITLAKIGDKVYFRNDITGSFAGRIYLNFKMTGLIAASGNINSMYSSTEFSSLTTLSYSYCYSNMFNSCTSLTQAPGLPATTLAEGCYFFMFYGCTSLTTAPELPATTLASSCYSNMFNSCTSLTQAPGLPATTLASSCYEYMFSGCTSLTTAPALPATTLSNYCYYGMFKGCTSLATPPALPATTLSNDCYSFMFYGCTSLTTAPALPATTLSNDCYEYMFKGCTSLQVSDTQTAEAPYAWHIPTTGTFTNTTTYNQSNMFTNCLGTRSSDNITGAQGESHTYYTQNQPI